MSKDMNQIITTEIESTEKESMFHKKTITNARLNPLCGSHAIPGSHSAPCKWNSSVHMLMDYTHGIGNLLNLENI